MSYHRIYFMSSCRCYMVHFDLLVLCIIFFFRISLAIFHYFVLFFFFKQKTAYEMRISDWSSDVCSSDLPTDPKRHPLHNQIRAPILYLPEYLYQQPLRVLRAWWKLRRQPAYRQVWQSWWRDLRRNLTPNRRPRIGPALVLAADLPAPYRPLHPHFLHPPTPVAPHDSQNP